MDQNDTALGIGYKVNLEFLINKQKWRIIL